MRHLHSDELIDLAEGTRPESSAPHLQSCEMCRRQLAEARAMMKTVAEVKVPEPSPLFWNHFSARVHEAITAVGAPRRLGWPAVGSWSRLMWPLWPLRPLSPLSPLSVGACVALLVAVTLLTGRLAGPPRGETAAPESASAVAETGAPAELVALPDDPSLDLVADLTEDMDWDRAREVGFAPRQDAVERAVGQLSDVERRELQRLLQRELRRSN
jgi:hypothetical protein